MGELIPLRPRLIPRAKQQQRRQPRLANIRDARRRREIRDDFAEAQSVASWGNR